MFKIFESKEKKIIKSHVRHLVRLAKSDGIFHSDELRFIKKVGKKNGLTDKEIDGIIQNPTSVDIVLPKDNDDKFFQIFDLVNLMLKDGEVNDAEMEFCMELANRLGFRKVIVGVLVAKIERGIKEGLTRKQIRKEADAFVSY
tara:strand:+ start:935 stop:1363 length:429 start_codon:yes stop_codon:yes gene_type:complete